MTQIKKIIGYLLVIVVLFMTVISILSIWDLIEIERIMNKSFKTVLILFLSTVVILVISANLLKDSGSNTKHPH